MNQESNDKEQFLGKKTTSLSCKEKYMEMLNSKMKSLVKEVQSIKAGNYNSLIRI